MAFNKHSKEFELKQERKRERELKIIQFAQDHPTWTLEAVGRVFGTDESRVSNMFRKHGIEGRGRNWPGSRGKQRERYRKFAAKAVALLTANPDMTYWEAAQRLRCSYDRVQLAAHRAGMHPGNRHQGKPMPAHVKEALRQGHRRWLQKQSVI